MIAALLLASSVPADFPKAASVTIAQVRADPRAWDGKWVRFDGYIDRCSRLSCHVAAQPGDAKMTLSFDSSDSFDEWIGPQLPARVQVTARIDSTCLIGFCTDRAPELRLFYVDVLTANLPNGIE